MNRTGRGPRAATIRFIAYGVRVAVRTNDRQVLPQLRDRLPPGWKRIDGSRIERQYVLNVGDARARSRVRRFHLLDVDGHRLCRTWELEAALEQFERDVKLYVAEAARNRIFVHASVAGWHDRAVVVPAVTLSGKSTLVAALVKAGASYYSDEYAVLDARGRVHPYLRPLALREPGSGRQRKLSLASLGGPVGRKPLRVGLIVVTQYRRDARWRPRHLTPGQGALALLANTVPARRDPRRALAAVRRAAAGALVLEGVRGEATETVESLLKELS